jgi:hypothetical protein
MSNSSKSAGGRELSGHNTQTGLSAAPASGSSNPEHGPAALIWDAAALLRAVESRLVGLGDYDAAETNTVKVEASRLLHRAAHWLETAANVLPDVTGEFDCGSKAWDLWGEVFAADALLMKLAEGCTANDWAHPVIRLLRNTARRADALAVRVVIAAVTDKEAAHV